MLKMKLLYAISKRLFFNFVNGEWSIVNFTIRSKKRLFSLQASCKTCEQK